MNYVGSVNRVFMQEALNQAQEAFDHDEVPVGAVIVDNQTNKVISKGCNMVERLNNPLLHAEIIAINSACSYFNSKNLSNCDIYISLEPCIICAATISRVKINKLFYAASDCKQGSVENGLRFFTSDTCFHKPDVYIGLLAKSSELLMKDFFRKLRNNKV